MLYMVFFLAALIVVCVVAVKFGGRDEKLVALALVVATFVTPWLMTHHYKSIEWWVFSVDVTLFAVLLWVAIMSDRFWPMWAAGFQLTSLCVHIGVRVWDTLQPAAYADMLGIWSHMVLYSLLAGVLLEAKTRNQ